MSSHKICIPSGVRNVLLTSLNDRMKTWRRRSTSSITRKVKIEYMFQFTISKTFIAVSKSFESNRSQECPLSFLYRHNEDTEEKQ